MTLDVYRGRKTTIQQQLVYFNLSMGIFQASDNKKFTMQTSSYFYSLKKQQFWIYDAFWKCNVLLSHDSITVFLRL